jgi:serine/threonine protein kinase
MRYTALTLHLRGTRGDPSGEASRTLRNPLQHRRGRDGRGVSRPRYASRPHESAHLFEIGQQDGIDHLVMEYPEGETLARRLLNASLALEQGSQYAIEIADAHRKGLTHRDLKPGDIMLTKTGTKLLDFNLAKLEQEVLFLTPVIL